MSEQNYTSFDGHGVDVASQRIDDLDRESLQHVKTKLSPSILDLGSGSGGHSLRLAQAGALVVAVDNFDFTKKFEILREENNLNENQLYFIHSDLIELEDVLFERKFDDVCLQRTLHYFTYDKAQRILKYLNRIVLDKLFISVTGIDSDIGKNYLAKNYPLNERMAQLSEEDKAKFQINRPLCLYNKEEFIDSLTKSGWRVEKCWESAFGNIKAICSHKVDNFTGTTF